MAQSDNPSHHKTALVTGGNGFLGSHLVRHLHQQGYWVRVLALPGTSVDSISDCYDDLVWGDICVPESLAPSVAGIDVVFHLAAMVTDWGPEDRFVRVNVHGTQNILDAAIQAGCRRFVHTSSLAVHRYRDITHGSEDWPRDATTPAYALSKKWAEDAVLARSHEIETVIIRPGLFPYGPGDYQHLPQLLAAIENGRFGLIRGGQARFCTSYVDNLVQGMQLAAEKTEAIGQIFVLCDDDSVSWREFSSTVATLLHVRPPRLSVPYGMIFPLVWMLERIYRWLRIRSVPPLTCYRLRVVRYHLVFSNEKARRLLGYQPHVDFSTGMKNTVDWYHTILGKHPQSQKSDKS